MASARGIVTRVYNGFNKRLARVLVPLIARPQSRGRRFDTLGSGDGKWRVPVDEIPKGAIAYCVGVGVDATFDVALASNYGAAVHSFDPTPRSIDYMNDLLRDYPDIIFHPIGIWNKETTLRFYAPMTASSPNYSARDIHGTDRYFEAKCKTVKQVMNELGHRKVDILKIDIEGAWPEVVNSIIDDDINAALLCVEFDSPTSTYKALKHIKRLAHAGYALIDRDRDNYIFAYIGANAKPEV